MAGLVSEMAKLVSEMAVLGFEIAVLGLEMAEFGSVVFWVFLTTTKKNNKKIIDININFFYVN